MKTEHRLPLGLCKQAVLKLESALSDIHEIILDEDISAEQKEWFEVAAEYLGNITAVIYNQVEAEMGEDEFIAEIVEMDQIESWPGETDDIMNQNIE